MHEIPNFPYPSLHEPQQPPKAQQAPGRPAELKANPVKAKESQSAKSRD
ncbi:hypothetical protein QN382_16925 [Pseudomonas sp. 10B1]|nr:MULTISPECIES: hypothetical protein [unclassified Pseudomonas]MDY7561111.1 hypothetical protein [Pseudomonas sp. AB6]MEA9979592.1 hypothetical protein [Pseudomonas sp. RTS4]MEA9997322.1 hypothetical protein [Pseudomonas sp. AA4]MEB0089006.1 hypothetical protein [Pseudomonas sp. RTI1]MEB0128320.1 hypothetical protein [Pseudomonas sp. CCC1.2]